MLVKNNVLVKLQNDIEQILDQYIRAPKTEEKKFEIAARIMMQVDLVVENEINLGTVSVEAAKILKKLLIREVQISIDGVCFDWFGDYFCPSNQPDYSLEKFYQNVENILNKFLDFPSRKSHLEIEISKVIDYTVEHNLNKNNINKNFEPEFKEFLNQVVQTMRGKIWETKEMVFSADKSSNL